MTDHQPAKTKLRYRAYYWLCLASFVAIVIGLANEVSRAVTGYDAFAFETTLQIVIGVPVVCLAVITPTFLIAIPQWRDEYAESVWKRTVGVMAVGFATAPPLLFIGAWILYFVFRWDEPPAFLVWLGNEAMIASILAKSWYAFSAAYVVIFQIIQWADRR